MQSGHWITVGGHPGTDAAGHKVQHLDGVRVFVRQAQGRPLVVRHEAPRLSARLGEAIRPHALRRMARANRQLLRGLDADLARMERDARALAEAEHRQSREERERAYRELLRDVRRHGGIRPRAKGHGLAEEFEVVPVPMRRRRGLSLDEMAAELGYPDEDTLRAAIAAAEERRRDAESLERHVARALTGLERDEAYVATRYVRDALRDQLREIKAKASTRAPGRRRRGKAS